MIKWLIGFFFVTFPAGKQEFAGVMAACFVFLALVPPELSFLGQVAYTAAIAFSGMNSVGVFKSAHLVSF